MENNFDDLVARQVEAYNARDLEGFLKFYAEDIDLINFPSSSLLKGKVAMRERYAKLFSNSPHLCCAVSWKRTFKNIVTYNEQITGSNGDDEYECIAIYEIENDLIQRLSFIWDK